MFGVGRDDVPPVGSPHRRARPLVHPFHSTGRPIAAKEKLMQPNPHARRWTALAVIALA
jgi:hypothetical protein